METTRATISGCSALRNNVIVVVVDTVVVIIYTNFNSTMVILRRDVLNKLSVRLLLTCFCRPAVPQAIQDVPKTTQMWLTLMIVSRSVPSTSSV
jgi:hypothetical protein